MNPTLSAFTARLATVPTVGRVAELKLLTAALDDAAAGTGATLFLRGEGGVGKTRLTLVLAEAATARGFQLITGRAYPVESGVPYALFSDAFVPMLRKLDPATLAVMTRGGSAELAHLFPALPTDRAAPPRGDPAELKARLLWNFSQFVGRLAAKQPLLVVLENLQWADASSIELLHFVARQLGSSRVLMLCTYNDHERDRNPPLRSAEQSLTSIGAARDVPLSPLSRDATEEIVARLFGVERPVLREFGALLYGWTRGNPFFVEETLKGLVESGQLVERDGRWQGWEVAELNLPRSIRDAVTARADRLSADARTVANLAAVIGARVTYDALAAETGLAEPALLLALDELRSDRVLTEGSDANGVIYDFAHPIIQDTLYGELGLARARSLHASIAATLERLYGARAVDHADELAFHYSKADARAPEAKAQKYLAAAGRSAVSRYANREAASYLASALDITDRATVPDRMLTDALVDDLARARQRLGDYAAATALWERARRDALAAGDDKRLASTERRMGLARYWSGMNEDALRHFDAGLVAAQRADDPALAARLHVAKGVALQELGQHSAAEREVTTALAVANELGDDALLARVHRASLLLHLWGGSPAEGREHGERCIELATRAGQRFVAWSGHWAMAMLWGLTGNAAELKRYIDEAANIADELRSPVLRLWTAEVLIEYQASIGDWDGALVLAEQTVTTARAIGQRSLLPRLLVWSGLIYLGRGELERAKAHFDEAWELSGAIRNSTRPQDVHTVVPAHMGLAAYHLAVQNYRQAIRVGEEGLAIADKTGYVVWAIHRLLPIIGEAALHLGDYERAEAHILRLRHDAERIGHRLGIAWAEAGEALIVRFRDRDNERAIELLRRAADSLDAVPMVEYAARIRRELGRALIDIGDREGASRELRRVHDVLVKLRADRDLSLVREMLRELGARPPARTSSPGVAGLTGRETEIVRLVAARKSNKEIGKALEISPRTASTHLSHIFEKLGVGSRGELADLARRDGLAE